MSEPTPLNADHEHRWRGFATHDHTAGLYCSVGGCDVEVSPDQLAEFLDAQATEIAILKDGRCVSCMEPVNPLHPKCACIRAEIAEMEAEIAALKGALESIEDAWAKLVEPGWQEHVASLKGADAPEASHAWVKHIFTFQLAGFRARVLAGKETRDE